MDEDLRKSIQAHIAADARVLELSQEASKYLRLTVIMSVVSAWVMLGAFIAVLFCFNVVSINKQLNTENIELTKENGRLIKKYCDGKPGEIANENK